MKIYKYRLIDLVNALESVHGKGSVWINAGFCDENDPASWNDATMNTPLNYKVAFPCDPENRMWVKCIPKKIGHQHLTRAFIVKNSHHFHWAMHGY
ncbi:hypothetical protein DSQ72_20135 [Salmonella enterica subsp. enterica serovar Montevideo]|uniref:hypothetical protein n=1 Tax=Enterobacter TaxID=547 RepID=UPI001418B207|nr:hypothetical protein [Enterobacter roggenkampii]EBX5660748.1 hypothetical protein [Salmonella enterica subsp. enterica serovar Montevideo]